MDSLFIETLGACVHLQLMSWGGYNVISHFFHNIRSHGSDSNKSFEYKHSLKGHAQV